MQSNFVFQTTCVLQRERFKGETPISLLFVHGPRIICFVPLYTDICWNDRKTYFFQSIQDDSRTMFKINAFVPISILIIISQWCKLSTWNWKTIVCTYLEFKKLDLDSLFSPNTDVFVCGLQATFPLSVSFLLLSTKIYGIFCVRLVCSLCFYQSRSYCKLWLNHQITYQVVVCSIAYCVATK